jgi:hypothetical protein
MPVWLPRIHFRGSHRDGPGPFWASRRTCRARFRRSWLTRVKGARRLRHKGQIMMGRPKYVPRRWRCALSVPAGQAVGHPAAGGRGDGPLAAGAGTGLRHRAREEREVDRRRVWQTGPPLGRPRRSRRTSRPPSELRACAAPAISRACLFARLAGSRRGGRGGWCRPRECVKFGHAES